MSKTVAAPEDGSAAMPHPFAQEFSLYAANGARKYLNQAERRRVLTAAAGLRRDQALFILSLAWTGARVSEMLALTPSSFQIDRAVVAIETLKRRRYTVREVPIPPDVMNALDGYFRLSVRQSDPHMAGARLWSWRRETAWRIIKRVMKHCGIVGQQACPRGLRHGFGIGTLQSGIPLNLTQRWMGHARISTTAIYAAASGPEEIAFATLFWEQPGPEQFGREERRRHES